MPNAVSCPHCNSRTEMLTRHLERCKKLPEPVEEVPLPPPPIAPPILPEKKAGLFEKVSKWLK